MPSHEQQLRIDDIRTLPDGRVSIVYTKATTLLADSKDGIGMLWESEQALTEAIEQAEREVEHRRLLIALGSYQRMVSTGRSVTAIARDLVAIPLTFRSPLQDPVVQSTGQR